MKNTRRKNIGKIGIAALVLSAALFVPAQADTLTFTNASASSAAAAMNKRYGVTIVFRGAGINTSQPVSFSVDNPDTPDGRLQAINSLASALNLDFQKVYVVSKADPGAAVPAVPMDSNGPIVFPSTHVPLRDAIQTVAAVDNALTQISPAIAGDISLPQTRLRAFEAASVISRQTRTQWKAYYGLYRRGEAPERFLGTIIDRTSTGEPIRALPLLTFRNTAPTPAPLHSGRDAVVGPFTVPSDNPAVASVPNESFGYNGYGGYGGYGDPFGYGSPFGYLGPNGSVAYPGAIYTPGAGVAPVVPGVNAPGYNAAAGPTGTTVLPTFPYAGSVGGQTMVGGY